jgi:DNA polymerase
MSSDSTRDDLLASLESVHEYANYARELGMETVDQVAVVKHEPSSVISATSTAAPALAVPRSGTASASLTARTSQTPATATKSRAQNSLFGDTAPTEPALPVSNETFEDIWRDIGDCTRCGLCEGRTQVVHTYGNRQARLMFVGEAPGADEDAQGRPFVGRAGQLLTKIIEAMGMKREDVLIGNVNRCRPPGNRQPTLEEAAICRPFLFREIASIRPEVIVVMGNTALRNLLETREGITRVRGQFQDFRGIKVMPTFHPAYLLRDPSKKRETWEDMKKVREYLDSSTPRRD